MVQEVATLQEPTWELQPGEEGYEFEWFRYYLGLSGKRQLTRAWKTYREVSLGKTGRAPDVPQTWRLAKEKWDWDRRVADYDRTTREEWESEQKQALFERRKKVFDEEWNSAMELLATSREMFEDAKAKDYFGREKEVGGAKETIIDTLATLKLATSMRKDAIMLLRRAAMVPDREPDDSKGTDLDDEFVPDDD